MTKLERLGYVVLFAHDLRGSKLFYTEKLGLRIRHEAEHYIEFDLEGEGVKFALYSKNEMMKVVKDLRKDFTSVPQQQGPQQDNFEIVFQVDNVQEVVSELKERGVVFLQEPARQSWGEITAYLRDPDGNLIELAQRAIKRTS